jgi:hypothetical protein
MLAGIADHPWVRASRPELFMMKRRSTMSIAESIYQARAQMSTKKLASYKIICTFFKKMFAEVAVRAPRRPRDRARHASGQIDRTQARARSW